MAADKDIKDAHKRFAYVQIRLAELAKERKDLLEERKVLGARVKAKAK